MHLFPELTFIPTEYANSTEAEFVIHLKKQAREHPHIKESFFVLWIPFNLSIEKLEQVIRNTFSEFPLEKSLSGTINLAYPIDFVQDKIHEKVDFSHYKMIMGRTAVKILPINKIIDVVSNIQIINVEYYSHLDCSASLYFWSLLTKLTLQLIAKGRYFPKISKVSSNQNDLDFFQEEIGTMESHWKPILKTERDIQNYKRILEYASISSHNIPPPEKIVEITDISIPDSMKSIISEKSKIRGINHLYSISKLSRLFIEALLDSTIRNCTNLVLNLGSKLPWDLRVLNSLLSDSNQFAIYDVKEENIPKIFERWSQKLNLSWNLGYSLKFQLDSPQQDNEQDKWKIKLVLHPLSDDSGDLPLQEFWNDTEKPTEEKIFPEISDIFAIREYVLKSLNILSKIFSPFGISLKEKYPYRITLSTNEVISLLQTGIRTINSYGYSFEIPPSFSVGGSQRIQPVLTIDSRTDDSKPLENYPIDLTSFDISSILTFEWVLKIGDNILSESEIEQLFKTDEEESLLFWNNKWIMIDKQDIKQFQEKSQILQGTLPGQEALKLALTQEAYLKSSGSKSSGPYPVQFYGPLDKIMKIIRGEVEMPHFAQPKTFVGVLRKYQEYGFNWMLLLTSIGFGTVLADDMGLGKTIQVIALILQILDEKKKNRNFLIICPTSVLGNWIRELHKFAPSIKSKLHYGTNRAKDINDLRKDVKESDVFLTSYNILRRDIGLLHLIKWESVILDESQNIKNYKTKQAKAVYQLVENTKRKIALSGTPIENRITELWSLYHFVNPFLLGARSKFMKRYAIPVGKLGNGQLTNELRNLVNPFLLRRMKTNKNIIPELPDKQETEVFVSLTIQQKQQYKDVVDKMLSKVKDLEENSKQKFAQKGLILTALMHLKQICNHPDQYNHTELKEIQSMDLLQFIDKSGKLQRFIELLEEAIASESKILIFTQFKVMGDIIQDIVERYYNIQVPFIHGGVSQENRTRIVQLFQEDTAYQYPLLLLSLRAGGVGLNLSKATTVIHYDRWWNPAVEDQATDRAYRIGQKNKVNVYKMVAEGTIEEKISKMLEEKRALAERLIKVTGEEWITEFSLGELQEMFQLEEE